MNINKILSNFQAGVRAAFYNVHGAMGDPFEMLITDSEEYPPHEKLWKERKGIGILNGKE